MKKAFHVQMGGVPKTDLNSLLSNFEKEYPQYNKPQIGNRNHDQGPVFGWTNPFNN